jgi:membrane protein implicated in regulation of membrane protease activity
MSGSGAPHSELDAERRRILRQVTLWTWIYGGLAAVLAIGAGAVAAWLLGYLGLPFWSTWLVATAVIAGVPVLIHLVQAFRRKHEEPADGD